uniref:Major facilitator superfamily protein n=1 Tax=Phyllotreta armoraciae TaxID=1553667 RepID=A0A858Z6J6_9CUCU|nr:major facilitator superfamily protein [Phyllotreta armoraciae]
MANRKNDTTLLEVKYVPVIEKSSELKPEPFKRPDTVYLMFSIASCVLFMVSGGSTYVWYSSALVKLRSNDSDINPLGRPITNLETSFLLAMPNFAGIFGALFLPQLSDKTGRKKYLLIMGLGMLVHYVSLAFSTSIIAMVVSAALVGVFFAGGLSIVSLYITELCEEHNRAKYGCINLTCLPLGQLYCYVVGPMFSMKYYILLLTVPLMLFLVFFSFAPESPMYLLAKGRKNECMRTLKRLRSNKSQKEIDIDFEKINLSLTTMTNGKKANYFTVFKSKEGRVGLLLAMIPLIGTFVSGITIIMPLLAPIFNNAGIGISGTTVAIIVGAFKICFFILTSMLIEVAGRRTMLLVSSIGCAIPMSLLGICFYLNSINSPLLAKVQWLPIVLILLYIFFYSLGLGPLPFTLMSEFFPTDVRSSAVSISTTMCSMIMFLYSFTFPLYSGLIGVHSCMWIFGMSSLAIGTVIYFCLPETKGKTIHEIQEMLTNY